MTDFHAIVAGRNCEQWAARCIQSLRNQQRPFSTINVAVDAPTDGTAAVVADCSETPPAVNLTFSAEHRGAMYHQVHMIRELDAPPGDVLVFVDLDDHLNGPNVTETLARHYADPRVELTYGSYITEPPSETCAPAAPFPPHVTRQRSFRKHIRTKGLTFNHLRTLRAGLFARIDDDQHWKLPDGRWLPAACDMAMMVPALEVAARHTFIEAPLYVYNTENNASDWRRDPGEVDLCNLHVLGSPKFAIGVAP